MIPAASQALDRLNVRILAAEAIGQALGHAAGDEAPGWVTVYQDQIEGLREAAEALEVVLRKGEP